MSTYYVTLNRPELVAATAEEAAQKCLTDPLGPNDVVFVKEVPVDGSMNYTPGSRRMVGGVVPMPDATYQGADLTPTKNKAWE